MPYLFSPTPLYSADARAAPALTALVIALLFRSEVLCRTTHYSTTARCKVLYGAWFLSQKAQPNKPDWPYPATQHFDFVEDCFLHICHTRQCPSDWLYPEELGSGFLWSSAYVQSELLGIANQTPLPSTRPQAPKKMALTKTDVQKAYEPRARLPVRPGGRCRRRLDGTLPVSN